MDLEEQSPVPPADPEQAFDLLDQGIGRRDLLKAAALISAGRHFMPTGR